MNHLRSGAQNQPGQHGETPSLLKIQKLAGREPGKQEEVAVSQDRATVLQPRHRVRLPLKKIKKEKKDIKTF